jgi:carbamoyl-phosphate synthase large subunit
MSGPCWKGNPQGMARILVTGTGGNVAQGILKALVACGLARWIVGTDTNPLSVGLYLVDKGYVIPGAARPEFVPQLVDILNREAIDLVLVGADAETIHLAQNRSEIESQTRSQVLVSPPEVVGRCHDKWQTALWFAEQGFSHPKTVLANDRAGVAALVKENGFPMVVKPRYGFASLGFFIAMDLEELHGAMARWGSLGIVQVFLDNEAEEFTASTFSSRRGQVDATIVLRRELLQGTSYRIEPIFDPSLSQTVRLWAERLGVLGPANFQFRLTPHGPSCFEVNGRFSGTTGVRFLLGYNDVELAIRSFLLGEQIHQPGINPGVVLRYWTELYLPNCNMATLSQAKVLRNGQPEF